MTDQTPHGQYDKEYSEESFWRKVRRNAFAAGRQVIEKALTLFYCLRDPDTPGWAKAVIIGALGYFILPMDAIPDLIPGAGYADDLGAITVALGTVAVHIKPEHTEKAKGKVSDWFDKDDGPKALPPAESP